MTTRRNIQSVNDELAARSVRQCGAPQLPFYGNWASPDHPLQLEEGLAVA
jgi:hypothetical protein